MNEKPRKCKVLQFVNTLKVIANFEICKKKVVYTEN